METINIDVKISPELKERFKEKEKLMAEFHKLSIDVCYTFFHEIEDTLTLKKIEQARDILGIKKKFKTKDYKKFALKSKY